MMSISGEIEQLFADQLYPYRWPLMAGLVLATLTLVAGGARLGWHRAVRGHPALAGVVAAVMLVAGVPAGYYTLSPLWTRSALVEVSPVATLQQAQPPTLAAEPATGAALPMATAAEATNAAPAEPPAPPPFMPYVTRQGEFRGADDFHFGRGQALIIETEPGRFVLRLEQFSVRNGPDLFVYLAPTESGIAGAVNLGRLKATDGAFHYEIPTGTELDAVRSALVWCRRFGVLFASAPLAPAGS